LELKMGALATSAELRHLRSSANSIAYQFAALRVLLAADILKQALRIEARFNPYHYEIGRFTTADGATGGSGSARDGRVRVAQAGPVTIPNRATLRARFPNATPAQEARLAVSDVLARQEIAETQALVPGYRPGPSFTESIEGEIARNEADAQAARDARYRYESESLTGAAGPGTAAGTHADVCFPGGNPIGVRLPGVKPRTRTLTPEEFVTFLRDITQNAAEFPTPASYQGLWYRKPNGEIAGVRFSSGSGLTVDIIRSNSPIVPPRFRVHSK
jgi:hypothetical protein